MMMDEAATKVEAIDGGSVRLDNIELHRRACKAVYEGDVVVFQSLPLLIHQIIEHRIWESYGHANFADYALDGGSNGLGVNTNQRLWLLRCAMDVDGKHVAEWTEVLAKVEELVRLLPASERGSIRSLDGNSLRRIATDVGNVTHDERITYLPSRAGNSADGALLRLRNNHPETFQRVLHGELTARQGMHLARKVDGVARRAEPTKLDKLLNMWWTASPEVQDDFVKAICADRSSAAKLDKALASFRQQGGAW